MAGLSLCHWEFRRLCGPDSLLPARPRHEAGDVCRHCGVPLACLPFAGRLVDSPDNSWQCSLEMQLVQLITGFDSLHGPGEANGRMLHQRFLQDECRVKTSACTVGGAGFVRQRLKDNWAICSTGSWRHSPRPDPSLKVRRRQRRFSVWYRRHRKPGSRGENVGYQILINRCAGARHFSSSHAPLRTTSSLIHSSIQSFQTVVDLSFFAIKRKF